jgi:hypothetical protein
VALETRELSVSVAWLMLVETLVVFWTLAVVVSVDGTGVDGNFLRDAMS